jgi:hypothetical protein
VRNVHVVEVAFEHVGALLTAEAGVERINRASVEDDAGRPLTVFAAETRLRGRRVRALDDGHPKPPREIANRGPLAAHDEVICDPAADGGRAACRHITSS